MAMAVLVAGSIRISGPSRYPINGISRDIDIDGAQNLKLTGFLLIATDGPILVQSLYL